MKKRKKIIVKIPKDGTVEIGTYCLATDSWEDYTYFLKAAQASKKDAKDRAANRELRAALLCLFSHLEGTVSQIFFERGKKFQVQIKLDFLLIKPR